jgi:hypothetical protein
MCYVYFMSNKSFSEEGITAIFSICFMYIYFMKPGNWWNHIFRQWVLTDHHLYLCVNHWRLNRNARILCFKSQYMVLFYFLYCGQGIIFHHMLSCFHMIISSIQSDIIFMAPGIWRQPMRSHCNIASCCSGWLVCVCKSTVWNLRKSSTWLWFYWTELLYMDSLCSCSEKNFLLHHSLQRWIHACI